MLVKIHQAYQPTLCIKNQKFKTNIWLFISNGNDHVNYQTRSEQKIKLKSIQSQKNGCTYPIFATQNQQAVNP